MRRVEKKIGFKRGGRLRRGMRKEKKIGVCKRVRDRAGLIRSKRAGWEGVSHSGERMVVGLGVVEQASILVGRRRKQKKNIFGKQ